MKTFRLFQIDAFTADLFGGNPAGVCPLDAWLPERTLQAIAAENNLPETAFFVPKGDGFHLRWFTPEVEVRLCGHATLACAHALYNHLGYEGERIRFESLGGDLSVAREGELLVLDFPSWPVEPVADPPAALLSGLGRAPEAVYIAPPDRGYYVVYASEVDVRAVTPDFSQLVTLEGHGVVVTAPGESSDCASRFFAPFYGIDEDPVTGSIHCALAPLWAARLDRPEIHARQVSARGGELFCTDKGDRVLIAGRAVTYLDGQITVPA
jgi:PhzF family phenazine biosynthesis protein